MGLIRVGRDGLIAVVIYGYLRELANLMGGHIGMSKSMVVGVDIRMFMYPVHCVHQAVTRS